jgi:hypothetical protein
VLFDPVDLEICYWPVFDPVELEICYLIQAGCEIRDYIVDRAMVEEGYNMGTFPNKYKKKKRRRKKLYISDG